jgi:threonine dehydratase
MSSSPEPDPPTPRYADVVEAARGLAGHAVVTPLLDCPALDALTGGRVLIKAETFQRTGSFKFRGAWNRISRIDPQTRAKGVVAYSSGNHAQAVAAVAKAFGIPATIVMPADAPRLKAEATRGWGATVVPYDRARDSREAIAERILAEQGGTLIPPFDDPLVMAGQGTAGIEIADQCAARGLAPDAVLVPVSGGGLIGGIALVVKERFPACALWAVEPAGFDDTARSLASGQRETNAHSTGSFCDALLVPTPGRVTFAVNRRLLAGGFAVTDAEAARAMEFAFRQMKLVLEPSGAAALAALLAVKLDCKGRTVVIVCSGGNVDAATFCAAIGAGR